MRCRLLHCFSKLCFWPVLMGLRRDVVVLLQPASQLRVELCKNHLHCTWVGQAGSCALLQQLTCDGSSKTCASHSSAVPSRSEEAVLRSQIREQEQLLSSLRGGSLLTDGGAAIQRKIQRLQGALHKVATSGERHSCKLHMRWLLELE